MRNRFADNTDAVFPLPKRLNFHQFSAALLYFLLLCLPCGMLLVPGLTLGSESECKFEEEIASETASTVQRVRRTRLKGENARSFSLSNAFSTKKVQPRRNRPLVGHRLSDDLLAPLTC